MLNPLYALKKEGVYAEYNKLWEYNATQDFIENLPKGGKDSYIQHLHNIYLSLYEEYLTKEAKGTFLDKTPRYYLIINELVEVFPEAKFILLIRNPLAVLGSIINSWTKENWYQLSQYKVDLINGIDTMLDGMECYKESALVFRYEDLLHNQTKALKKCFTYIELEFEEEILNYHQQNSEKWLYGDSENIYAKKGIDTSNDLKWLENLNKPQYWRVMYDYLHFIGEHKLHKLGYSFDEMHETLLNKMPFDTIDDIKENTIPLNDLLPSTRECLIETKRQQNILINKETQLQNQQQVINQKEKEIQEKQQKTEQKIQENVNINELLQEKDKLLEIYMQKNQDLLTELTKIKSSKVYKLMRKI